MRLFLFRKRYKLLVDHTDTDMVSIIDDMIELKVKKDEYKHKSKVIDKWYKDEAKRLIEELFEKNKLLFLEHGIKKPEFKYRKMTSRWGSCNYFKSRITINTELIKYPLEFLEYVLMHEVCHLIHNNHSQNFYELFSNLLPNWKEYKKELNRLKKIIY